MDAKLRRDIVVIGASAGGVEALRSVVAGFPKGLAAAILIVLHIPCDAPSALSAILSRSGPLPAHQAVEGEPVRHGRIYLAPADRHLLLLDGQLRLSREPAENGHRPAIDPLFRSVARGNGPGVIGVVLSGARDDGASGLAAIVARGGTAIVQDPADAMHPSMPQAAIARVAVEHVAPAAAIGGLIAKLVEQPVCPAPGGAEVSQERPLAGGPLLAEQAIATEGALWMALRALQERSTMFQRMADHGGRQGCDRTSLRYRRMADDATRAATLIRELIEHMGDGHGPPA